MVPDDVGAFVDELAEHGIDYLRDGKAVDLVVVDQRRGPMVPCDWAECIFFRVRAGMAACPDDQWRLVFALARYGGLRIPSEIQGLRWTDIDWYRRRFRVHSPKTEHIEGKKHRDVPLFPELVPYFETLQKQQPKDEALVFPALVKRSNLREHALRIIRKAGIDPWTRVFQNLRASRETELVEDFPIHVVASWLGNSPDTAARHYLTVLDAHFERAASGESQSRGTYMGHSTAVRGCQALTPKNDDPSEVTEEEGVDNESQREAIPGKKALAPHTLYGSNTLLVWLKRAHAFERSL